MSLNWREIETVLAELSISDCWLKRVRQPDYARIILEFSRPGHAEELELVLKAPFVRINRIGGHRRLPRALPSPPRFAAVIKSKLEGTRLRDVHQLGRDRIVRFTFSPGDEICHLDAKLWGNAANLILSGDDGVVIDAFSRRPKRGEAPGGHWPPEGISPDSPDPAPAAEDLYIPREFPGTGNFNLRMENHYLGLEETASLEQRVERWKSWLKNRESTLTLKKQKLNENRRRFEKQLRDSHWADLIMANLHQISKGDTILETQDWEEPGNTIRIPLKSTLSPQDNAQAFYSRQKRARRAMERLDEDLKALEKSSSEQQGLLHRLESGDMESPPFDEEPPVAKKRQGEKSELTPGLWIRRNPYIIAVGRNARESDWLLRHWAKGNDTWLHVRDWPGGHVFVRPPRGKSIPLEILLDAGNLALSYSKGKSAIEADLYYTQVKNLRRAKDGPAGTVLPTREKNLRIRLDKKRLETLRELAETG